MTRNQKFNPRLAGGYGVPKVKEMKWRRNRDGKFVADYSHLHDNGDGGKEDKHERQPDGSGVPKVREMKWNKDGSPDYSFLDRK